MRFRSPQMQMSAFNENPEFLQRQISTTDDNQSIHALPCIPRAPCSCEAAELGVLQQQFPSAAIHLVVNKLSSLFTLPLSPSQKH